MAVFTGNGSAGSPSFTFSSDTDTGFYRYGDGDIGVTLNGNLRARFEGSALNISSSTLVASAGIDQDLKIYGHTSASGLFVGRWGSGDGCVNDFFSNRNVTVGSFTAPNSGDELCRLRFFTHDTTAYREAASITTRVGTYTGTDDVGGEIWLNTRPTGAGANNLNRAKVTQDGYFRMASATGGIQFNGDSAAANALDDYEEGTWTPTVGDVSAGTTSTPSTASFTSSGTYTKIGRTVTVNGTFNIGDSGTNVTVTDRFSLTGLPFNLPSGNYRGVGTFGGPGPSAPLGSNNITFGTLQAGSGDVVYFSFEKLLSGTTQTYNQELSFSFSYNI